MTNEEEKQLADGLNNSKQRQIGELLSELLKQKFIEDADYTSADSVVITTSVTYHNGPAIKIRISKEPSNSDDLLLSDEGHTINFLRETVGDSWSIESFDRSLSILKQPVIERADNVLLSHILSDSTDLIFALTQFVTACRTVAIFVITSNEIAKGQKAKERAVREERERKAFRLKSRDEIVIFEQRLRNYARARMRHNLDLLSLVDAYDFLNKRQDRDQVFAAILDLIISYCALLLDSTAARQTWQYYFGEGRIENGSILDSPEAFAGRMDIHRYNTSFVLRYRALWDKIMGLIVLLMLPGSYQSFIQAKSRKQKFINLIKGRVSLFSELAQNVIEITTDFDNRFRTAEAHGPGTIRKWTLIIEPIKESPQMDLLQYRLWMDSMLTHLGNIFRGPEKTLLRNIAEIKKWVVGKVMPTDLQSIMLSMIHLLEQIVPLYVSSHHSALVRLYSYTNSLFADVFYRWYYQRADRRELMDKSIAELEAAASELSDFQTRLLNLINSLANYTIGEDRNQR